MGVSSYNTPLYMNTCFDMCQQGKPSAISYGGPFAPKGSSKRLAVRAELDSRTCGPNKNESSLLALGGGLVQVMQKDEGPQEQQDWRAFRASLCTSSSMQEGFSHVPPLWAHEIAHPEEGCLLVATHHLDTHPLFQKSLVLLTRSPRHHDNSSAPTWTGLLINKPLPYPVSDVEGVDDDVALGLAHCPAFLGGSLIGSRPSSFHTMTTLPLCGHRPLLPGLHLGTGDAALLAAWGGIQQKMLLPQHVRVLLGQLQWDAQTLGLELSVFQWWRIVSCHSSLLLLHNVDCMWDTLQSLLGIPSCMHKSLL